MLFDHLLTILIFLPMAAALLLAVLPGAAPATSRIVALGATLVNLVLAVVMAASFQPTSEIQFKVNQPWLSFLGINYFIGVDGINVFLVLLVAVLSPLAILAAWNSVQERVRGFMISMLLVQAGMIGSFVSFDLFLFYIFFELMLIPTFFAIGIWGGPKRVRATVKFMIYTMLGSLFMFVAIIYMAVRYRNIAGSWSFSLPDLQTLTFGPTEGFWLLLAFLLAFGIKSALFPLHTWLPDTYTEAPAPTTFLLSAIMAKLGLYGLVRFVLPIFAIELTVFAPTILALGVIGIIYGALIALVQRDAKRMIAYSSFSHLGLIFAGIMAFNLPALQGGVYHMLNHAISTGCLFLLLGVLFERRGTMEISSFGGLVKAMPVYATVFLIALLASVGLPGLNGFVGEFLLLLGTFGASKLWGAIAAVGVILSAAYMLWLFQRTIFGAPNGEANEKIADLNRREVLIFTPLVLLMILLGVFPQPVLSRIEPTTSQYLSFIAQKQGGTAEPTIQPAPPQQHDHDGDAALPQNLYAVSLKGHNAK